MTAILADIYDAINQNTRGTGNWRKGKVPKIPPYPRPKQEKATEAKKVTVKTLFRQMNGG